MSDKQTTADPMAAALELLDRWEARTDRQMRRLFVIAIVAGFLFGYGVRGLVG